MKKLKRKIIGIILIMVISIGVSSSYAKYSSRITGRVTANIAEPIIQIKSEESIVITAIEPIQNYDFSIMNYNEKNKITEVKMNYYIEFIYKEEKIKLEIYKNDKKIEIKDKKTAMFLLEMKEKQEDIYLLKIIYEKTEEDINKDILEEIKIKVHTVQEK